MFKLDPYDYKLIFEDDRLVRVDVTVALIDQVDIADIVTEATAYSGKGYVEGYYFYATDFVTKTHPDGKSKVVSIYTNQYSKR